MKHSKILQNALQKIQQEDILPRPRWHFILKNIVFWLFFAVSVILGALGVAVVIFALFEQGIEFVLHFKRSGFKLFLQILPVFWLVFFAIFLAGAVWGLSSTRKGYKFAIRYLILGNIVLSIVLGSIGYFSGLGQRFENQVARHIHFYHSIQQQKDTVWQLVDEGMLGGKIEKVEVRGKVKGERGKEKLEGGSERAEKYFILRDPAGGSWEVDFSKATLRQKVEIQKGVKVRMLGQHIGPKKFQAEVIGRWQRD